MPAYTMDLHIKTASGELGGQNWLTVGYPGNDQWGICSSNVGLFGLKGKFNYSEKLGYEGTTFFKEGSSEIIVLRLAVFRGGNIDAASWDVGKGGEGQWITIPNVAPQGFEKKFTWTIHSINRERDL